VTTLRDLAQSLGLSITTVSRALDGYNDVSPITRERVRKAAAELGYRPNPVARRLRKGTSETIALVMPTEAGRFYEPAFVELLSVVGESLARKQLDLMLLAARPGAEEMSVYRRLVEGRRADVCILIKTRREDERIHYLEQQKFPYVCLGRTEKAGFYPYVDGAGDIGFADLTTRLIGRGHRRLGLVSAHTSLMFAEIRMAGWLKAMKEADLPADRIIEASADEEGGYLAASQLLAKPEPPDALICTTDRMAIGAMRAAKEAGREIGRDVAISGHDNISAAAFAAPALTTMEMPIRDVGTSIVEKVIALAGGAKASALTQELFPLRHLLRASTGESA
jgi:LacI family transcriptional regulator